MSVTTESLEELVALAFRHRFFLQEEVKTWSGGKNRDIQRAVAIEKRLDGKERERERERQRKRERDSYMAFWLIGTFSEEKILRRPWDSSTF